MKTEFTSTIKTTVVSAFVVDKGSKKPVAKNFALIGKLSNEQAEKAVEKQGKKQGFRLAWIESLHSEEKLYPLSIELFLRYAVKLSRRGENGRTRDPLVTRTVQTTYVAAFVVDKGSKKPVERTFVLDGFLSDEEAEKVIEKQGKKHGFRLAWVDGITEEEAVYEMLASSFVFLSGMYTRYGEKTGEVLDMIEATTDRKMGEQGSDSDSDSDSDSNSDSNKA